ncbi:MAG: DUF2878 domain-containing protein [Gammaproteobacteria bacterium]|jgi:hypothetical protein
MPIVINFVLFQAGWFAAVFGAAGNIEWLAVSAIAVIIFMHMILVKQRWNELSIVIGAGIVGTIIDSTLISQGVFSSANPGNSLTPGASLAPLWLIALWMLFAITINHSLGWLRRNFWLQPLAGFVFAPMAYYAGHKLGALNIDGGDLPYSGLLTIGICWMFVIPLLFWLADTINRQASSAMSYDSDLR